MVLVQIYLNATSQNIDLQLQPAIYRIQLVGIQYNYTAADANLFTVEFRSPFTMQKYGNQRYLMCSNPPIHHAAIQGPLIWEGFYNGQFAMELIDKSTNAPPIGSRFTECVMSFDVTKISETNTVPE
jgi:hypothetical protein